MTEQQIQKKITNHLEDNGLYSIKLIKTNKNGIADILAIHDTGVVTFIEVKKPNGVESKLQEFRRLELMNFGIKSFIVYGYDDYMNKIGQYL